MSRMVIILIILTQAAAYACRHASATPPPDQSTPAAERPTPSPFDASLYSGGDGRTRETAVVVGTKSHRGGVASEYSWIRHHYPDAKHLHQALTRPIDGKRYDVLTIQPKDGGEVELWFDITAFLPAGDN